MPCLDANALTDDAAGLEFLRAVLDVPAHHAIPVGAFDPSRFALSSRSVMDAVGGEEIGVRHPALSCCEPA